MAKIGWILAGQLLKRQAALAAVIRLNGFPKTMVEREYQLGKLAHTYVASINCHVSPCTGCPNSWWTSVATHSNSLRA